MPEPNGFDMPRDLNPPWQRQDNVIRCKKTGKALATKLGGGDCACTGECTEEFVEPPEIPTLSEDQLADPLRSIATLILALPCNQMWRMVGDDGMRKPELDKIFVAWAEAYLAGQPMADITQGRRA